MDIFGIEMDGNHAFVYNKQKDKVTDDSSRRRKV
jgi:hypothetical protein